MSSALAVIPDNNVWQVIKELDAAVYQSRKYGTSQGELVLRCLTAFEMGLPLSAGQRGINIIDNKPAIAPKLAWALITGHKDFAGYEEARLLDDKGAFLGYEITLQRNNNPIKKVTRRFTLDDARRIKQGGKPLAAKDNYQNYPEQMCYWRALGACEDVQWADVTFGIPCADELGANITPDGDVIEGQFTTAPAPSITLDMLLAQYTPDEIMTANGGAIPGTAAEIAAVFEVLNAA